MGGLVGYSIGGIIDSYATSSVSGTVKVGGLVGYSQGRIINTSYATGSVSGSSSVGGLVGRNSAKINASYASGCQWNLRNVGQSGGKAGEDINVLPAWETTLGEGATVVVVDSTYDPAHEDLRDNADTGKFFKYGTAWTGPDQGYPWNQCRRVIVAAAMRQWGSACGTRGVAPRA